MSKTVLLMLLIALALSAKIKFKTDKGKDEFFAEDEADFNEKFSKKYERRSKDLKAYKMMIFKINANEVRTHNSDESRTYDKGTNFLSDLTREEFVKIYLGLKVPANLVVTNIPQTNVKGGLKFNPINWNSSVTSVKNQGFCNACWAFSTLAAIESAYKRKSSLTLDLSQQELVDCSSSFGNSGCSSGWLSNALSYVKTRKVNVEMKYPYTSTYSTTAKACKNIPGTISIKSYVQYSTNSCSLVVSSLANYGPVAVAVDSTYWNTYKTGVFNYCAASSVNHGVLLVGASNTEWRIKNSWGTAWGESGFMRLLGPNSCSNLCFYHNYVTI